MKFYHYLSSESKYASKIIASLMINMHKLTEYQQILLTKYLQSNNWLAKYFVLKWLLQLIYQQNDNSFNLDIDGILERTYNIVKKIQQHDVWVYDCYSSLTNKDDVFCNYFSQIPILAEGGDEYQNFVLRQLKQCNFIFYLSSYNLQNMFKDNNWEQQNKYIIFDKVENDNNLIMMHYNDQVLNIKNYSDENVVNNLFCQCFNDNLKSSEINVTPQLITLQLINIQCMDFSQCTNLQKIHLNKVNNFNVEYLKSKEMLIQCVLFAVNEQSDEVLGNKVLAVLQNAQNIELIDIQHIKFKFEPLYQLNLTTPKLKHLKLLNNKNLHTISIQQANIQLTSIETMELDCKIVKQALLKLDNLQVIAASNCSFVKTFNDISNNSELEYIGTLSDQVLKFQLMTIKYCEIYLFERQYLDLQQFLLKQLVIKLNQQQRKDIQYFITKLFVYIALLPTNIAVLLILFLCHEQIKNMQIIDISNLHTYQIQTENDPIGKIIEDLAVYIVFHVIQSQCYTLFDIKVKFLISLVMDVKIFSNGQPNKYFYNTESNTQDVIKQWFQYLIMNSDQSVMLSPQFQYHDTFYYEFHNPVYMESYEHLIEQVRDNIIEYMNSITEDFYNNEEQFKQIFINQQQKLYFIDFIDKQRKQLAESNFRSFKNIMNLNSETIEQDKQRRKVHYIYGTEGSVSSININNDDQIANQCNQSFIIHSYSQNQRVGRIGIQLNCFDHTSRTIINISLSLCHCPSLAEFVNTQRLAMFKVVGINVQEIKNLKSLTHFYGQSLKIDADFQKTFNSNNIGHLATEILYSCLQIRVIYLKTCQMDQKLVINIAHDSYRIMQYLKELHLIENLGLQYLHIQDEENDKQVSRKLNIELLNLQPHVRVSEIHCKIDNTIQTDNLKYIQGDSTYNGFIFAI